MEEYKDKDIERIKDDMHESAASADRIIKELENFLNDGNTDKDDKEA